MNRPKRYLMKLAERELQLGDRTLIMGIINVTPDSFSDGGKYMDPDRAAARALELEAEGADIIDIGAESTRPGAERVSEAEELRRLIPVLKKLKGKLSVPISVDTMKAAIAAKALENGAELINDASTLTFDGELAKVISDANAGLILNHMRGTPETWAKLGNMAYPMKSVMEDLEAGINRARRAGIDRSRILVDPGLGFGKRGEQNYELLARLGDLATFDLPVLVGPSRKSFLGQQETLDADRATAAAVTVAVMHGAHVVRVHDVAAIRAVLQTADGILRSVTDEPEKEKKPKKSATAPRDVEFGEKRPIESTEGKPLRPPSGKPKVSSEVKPFEERPRPAARFDRDDRPPARRFDSADRPPARRFDSDDRPPRRFDDADRPPPKRFDRDDRPARPPYRDDGPPKRFGAGGDRPPFKKTYGEKNAGDRPPFKKPYGDRGGDSDRPPYKKPFGDRPPYKRPSGEGGDRPPYKKSFGEGGDRPPYRKPYSESGGDRPPYKKPYGEGGDRPPFKKSFSGGKPPFKKDAGGSFKPKRSPVRSPRPKRDN